MKRVNYPDNSRDLRLLFLQHNGRNCLLRSKYMPFVAFRSKRIDMYFEFLLLHFYLNICMPNFKYALECFIKKKKNVPPRKYERLFWEPVLLRFIR